MCIIAREVTLKGPIIFFEHLRSLDEGKNRNDAYGKTISLDYDFCCDIADEDSRNERRDYTIATPIRC